MPETTAPSPAWFRHVLGNYPTGITVMTARDSQAEPVGMVIGSFTSVSLEPPLVAFYAAKSSTTWPAIASCGSFCVNILGAGQEDVCRDFSAKAPNRFAAGTWRPAPSGNPILLGCVAWLDCEIIEVHEAGDHWAITGRVVDLDVNSASLPLLFFHGGYGRFTPLSLLSNDDQLLSQIRLAALARDDLESLADEFAAGCIALAPIGNEIVVIASAGRQHYVTSPSRVGRRQPFVAPVGAQFLAWDDNVNIGAWAEALGLPADEALRAECEAKIATVRRRGFSVTTDPQMHAQLETLIGRLQESRSPELKREYAGLARELFPAIDPPELGRRTTYAVRAMHAPVFDRQGCVAYSVGLYPTEPVLSGEEIRARGSRLLEVAVNATKAANGRPHDSWPPKCA